MGDLKYRFFLRERQQEGGVSANRLIIHLHELILSLEWVDPHLEHVVISSHTGWVFTNIWTGKGEGKHLYLQEIAKLWLGRHLVLPAWEVTLWTIRFPLWPSGQEDCVPVCSEAIASMLPFLLSPRNLSERERKILPKTKDHLGMVVHTCNSRT